jgi:3-methyl-2-oxobutanoate hydroxymethyltransferase
VAQGIPVMGHIGLTPQSLHVMGGYRVQGKTAEQALALLDDALALAQAGVFSIVLEGVPDRVAAEITRRVPVPTIGIGAGAACDAQILVLQDALGISERLPKFAVAFGHIGEAVREALEAYRQAVWEGRFPDADHSYHMEEGEWQALAALLAKRDGQA